MPVFQALKEEFPNAEIFCVGPQRIEPVMSRSPFVDHFVIFDERNSHRSLKAKWQFVQSIRKEKIDMAFLLHGSLTRALLIWLSGIPERIGYPTKKRGFLLTYQVEELRGEVHRMDYYCRVIEDYGIPVKSKMYALNIKKEDEESLNTILKQKGLDGNSKIAVLHVGANWELKRWPKEYFSKLGALITEELGLSVVISGSDRDRDTAEEIAVQSRANLRVTAGETTIGQLMALLKRATVVVAGDTGPLHFAAALGTPVVGLFGPTRPEITGPKGKGIVRILQENIGCNKAPCYNLGCPENVCLKLIEPQDVIYAIRQILDKEDPCH